jgi:rubrerythrin
MTADPARPALELALEAEKESLRGYLHWAFATRNPHGKDMFIRLATDEFEHLRLLERQLRESGAGDECAPVPITAGELEQLVARLPDASLRIRGEQDQGDLSALEAALESERRAEAFYVARARTPGPAAATFGRLAEMERAHAALIQAEIDHIQATGFWFDVQEFTLEGA